MAVNPQKFLPSSKGGSIVKVAKNISKSSISTNISENSLKNISIIRVKVVEIDKILKGTLASQKKDLDDIKRKESTKRREKIEEKLETKPNAEKEKVTTPKIPRMGFLDWIKNFIGNIILGYFAVRLIDHLPKLKGIISFIGGATDFVLNWGGKLLNGLVTFIDWGYKAYDATRGFIKNLFGNDGVKQFDQLSSLLNQFLNLAIIAGMAAAGSGGFGGKGGRAGAKPRITTSGGGRSGGVNLRNPLRQRPTVTTGVGGKSQFRLPGAGARVTTSGGKRALLSSVRPFLKRIPLPVIGALIDFGLSVALGENPGRAAFRAIGAGILGTIGAGLAGVLGLAGGPLAVATAALGSIAGGTLGDMAGGALYDLFFGGKKPSGKSGKYASGGITRGGKSRGAVKRSVGKTKKGKYKRKVAKKPEEIQMSPGADVGGEEKLFGLFPNPIKFAQKAIDVMNPFKVIQSAGKNLGKSDYFGPILAITSKILLGQKPSQKDYDNVGLGINLLVSKGINEGNLKGGLVAAFAEGGFVDPKTLDAISEGGDISDWVAKSFKDATESNAQKTLREIQENLRLKKLQVEKEKSVEEPSPGEELGGNATDSIGGARLFMQAGFPMLASAILSGNIQQESGWKGQRTPWVLNDGAGTNKGLISWNRSRIVNAEKFLGKPLEKASNAEQVKWIKEELNQYGLLKIFLDPKSTEQQLKDASYKYIGWGDLGDRWKYSSQIFAALQRGEKGTFVSEPSVGTTGPTLKGKFGLLSLGGSNAPGGDKTLGSSSDFKSTHLHHNEPDSSPHNSALISQGFGPPRDYVITRGGQNMDRGAPVPAGISGIAKISGMGLNAVDIVGNDGRKLARFFHNDTIKIKDGQKVSPSTIIATQGNTGTGVVHVHMQASPDVQTRWIRGITSSGYEKGGPTLDGPHLAMLGEKGKEFVIDADSTAAVEKTFPGFFASINQAKYGDAINVLRNFASYESESMQTIVVPLPDFGGDDQYQGLSGGSSTSDLSMFAEDEDSNPFDSLYVGG